MVHKNIKNKANTQKNKTSNSNFRKKKRNMLDLLNNKKLLVVFVVLAFIAIYCIYKVIALIQNPADTFSVEQGKIYEEEMTTGYIIREETVVKGSNYKNGMSKIKAEGERVAKNDAIFRYYSSGEEDLIKKIADLDVKIDAAMAESENILYGDVKTIEQQIEEQIESLRYVNSMQTIEETKKNISNNIVKKAKIAGEYSPAGSYLKKLIDERSKYENQLNSGAEYLEAPISGVVSYKVDGYEEILTPSDFSTLTKDSLSKIDIKTGQVVADSLESGKIINNFNCYVACILNSEQAKNADVGKQVKLRLPNNKEVVGTIEYISKEDDDVILVFELKEQVQELISYRKISFDIIWWSYSGKKVPNSAIGTETKGENEVSYVIRTRAGYQDKILVKVMKQNEKYAIIDNYTNTELKEIGYSAEEIKSRKTLTLYDEILKNTE